jgi:hypothetical protein
MLKYKQFLIDRSFAQTGIFEGKILLRENGAMFPLGLKPPPIKDLWGSL